MTTSIDTPVLKGPIEDLDITIVNSDESLEEMCRFLEGKDPIAFDTEATTIDMHSDSFRLVGMSFAADAVKSFYIPVGHRKKTQLNWLDAPLKQLPIDKILGRLDFMWNEKRLIVHNMKFDYEVMLKLGITIAKPWYCTMIAQYLLDNMSPLALKVLTRSELGRESLVLREVTKKGASEDKAYDLSGVDISYTSKYAAPDASNCFELYEKQLARFELEENRRLKGVLFEIEMPLVPAVAEMEMEGLCLDESRTKQLHAELSSLAETRKAELRKGLRKICGTDMMHLKHEDPELFEPGNQSHCLHVFYTMMNLPPQVSRGRKTRAGASPFATDKRAIDDIMQDPQMVPYDDAKDWLKLLLDWREVFKLDSTYTENLLELRSPDGKLHPDFQMTKTNTGRLACRRPNTTNIPKRKDAYDIRSIFVPGDPDWVFVTADYDAQEMKVAAALSG